MGMRKYHLARQFSPSGNKRTRRRRFGRALGIVQQELNQSDLSADEQRMLYLASKHELEFTIRPIPIVIRRSGRFSVEAAAAAQAFFEHKRRHPIDVPYHKMTPLQRRMQSGGA